MDEGRERGRVDGWREGVGEGGRDSAKDGGGKIKD